MTVFTLPGSKVFTDPLGQIVKTEVTSLDVVTRIGTNTLELAYLGDQDNPFSVSLGDYNLLFDGIHLNDGLLPDGMEFFDLINNDGYSVRVVNFVFNSNDGVEERMYSVGPTPMPQFQTPLEASTFLAQYEPVLITGFDDMNIRLDHVTNVETKGVFIDLANSDANYLLDENDGFDFRDIGTNSDQDPWDSEFVVAAHAEEVASIALAAHNTEEKHETEKADWAEDSNLPLDPPQTEFTDG